MKNPLIFEVSSTSTIRRGRQKLASQKAGFFRFNPYGETALFTCRDTFIMGVSARAERLVLDSGKGITLFLCPKLNIKYDDHHTTFPAPPTIGAPSTSKPATSAHGLISPNLLTRISPCS